MTLPNINIKVEANVLVIFSVIAITVLLVFVPEVKNEELFKLGFTAVIAWGSGYATGKAVPNQLPPILGEQQKG